MLNFWGVIEIIDIQYTYGKYVRRNLYYIPYAQKAKQICQHSRYNNYQPFYKNPPSPQHKNNKIMNVLWKGTISKIKQSSNPTYFRDFPWLSLVFPAKGLLPWSLQDLLSGGPSFPESPLPLRSSKVFVCFCWSLERFKVNSNLLSLQRSWKQTCPAKVFKWSWDTNSWWQ